MTSNSKTIARHEIELPGCEISPDWIIGSTTRRVDSWSPSIEQVLAPRVLVQPRRIEMRLADGVSDLSQDRWQNLLRRVPIASLRKPADAEGILFDTRFDTTHNYAHVLVNLIGRLLLAKSEGIISNLADVCVVVSENAPQYARELWRIVGVKLLATNSPVAGRHLTVSNSSNAALMLREEWSRFFAPLIKPAENGPKKIYLSRRGPRSVRNEPQVRELLESRGYTTIYPEDHAVEKQLAFFLAADEIIAVHGAGLAGLVLKTAANRYRLTEIFGAGYIVQVYRILTRSIGCDWLGIRGTVETGDVKLDEDSRGARGRQSAPFAVDVECLKAALNSDTEWIAQARCCTSVSTIVLK